MNVLIDTGKLKDLYSGLGQMSIHFGKAMAKLASNDMQFAFIVPAGSEGVFGDKVSYITDTVINRLRIKFTGYHKFQLLHYLHQDVKLWQLPLRLPYIVTTHDLNFLYHKSPAKAQKYLYRLKGLMKEAKHIVVISNYTQADLLKHIPNLKAPVTVIHQGVDRLMDVEPTMPNASIQQPFLFAISVLHPKKNFEALIDMMPYVQDYTIVIAGSGDASYKQQLQQRAQKAGVAEKIIFAGKVSNEEKVWLYRNCAAFVHASKAEGFGAPVLEVMQFGKPVFLLNSTSLPEFGATYARYWQPGDNGKQMSVLLRQGLQDYLQHPQLLEEMKAYAAAFNWENNTAAYYALYNQLKEVYC